MSRITTVNVQVYSAFLWNTSDALSVLVSREEEDFKVASKSR